MTRIKTTLTPLRIPGRAPQYVETRDDALSWLNHIERHELGEWLKLPRSAVFAMAPSCLEPQVPLERKARIVALLAAQLHPDALSWLKRFCHSIDPTLRPLAQVAWEQAAMRAQALSLCLTMRGLTVSRLPSDQEENTEAA